MWICRCLLYTLLIGVPFLGATLQPSPDSLIKGQGIHTDFQIHPGSYYFYNTLNQDILKAWMRYTIRHRFEPSSRFSGPLREYVISTTPKVLVFYESLPNAAGETITIDEASRIIADVRKKTMGIRGTLNSLTWYAAVGNHPGTPGSQLLARGYAVGVPSVVVDTLHYIPGTPAEARHIQALEVPILAAIKAIGTSMVESDRFPAQWSYYFQPSTQSASESDVGILIRATSQEQQPEPSRHDLLVMGVKHALLQIQTRMKVSREVERLVNGFKCDILQFKKDATSMQAAPTDRVNVGEVIVVVLEPGLGPDWGINATAYSVQETE